MPPALRLGLSYFAIVFAVGFALGPLREFVLMPRLGALGALLIEAPAMLFACWATARWLLRPADAALDRRGAAQVGAVALACLVVAELVGAFFLRRMTPAGYLAHLGTGPGLVSLVLFVAFAVMPWMIRRRTR